MNTTTLSKPSMPQDSLPFVHSGLAVLYSPVKGRVVTASTTIERGTVLMVDLPYSLVPAPLVHEPPFSICSNSSCHRRVKRVNASSSASSDKYQTQQTAPISPESEVTHRTNQLKQPVPCSKHCAREILWCSDNCRSKDARRHLSECAWLRTCGAQVQAEESIVEFELLWLLVKIFIRKQLDEQTSTHGKLQHSAEEQRKQKDAVTIQSDEPPMTPQSHFEQRGWDSVWDLAGSPDGFPAEDVARWRKMADIYLVGQIPDVECTTNQAMGLICRLETNSFGLYPGVTGIYPITSREGRGDYYGSGLYPTAAMFNHACCPNVSLPLVSRISFARHYT